MRTIGRELALGMDAALEAAERELAQVRAILRLAVTGLVAEFGPVARREGVVALQFQDVSDQILTSAGRRLEMLRHVLGKDVAAPPHADPTATPLAAGTAEYFQE
ncbi:MAG: hypothetical protein ABI789_02675 [Usitatibacter sp.]